MMDYSPWNIMNYSPSFSFHKNCYDFLLLLLDSLNTKDNTTVDCIVLTIQGTWHIIGYKTPILTVAKRTLLIIQGIGYVIV